MIAHGYIFDEASPERSCVGGKIAASTVCGTGERFVDDNTLTVNINRFRRKIEQAGIQGYIETKVGRGYIVPPKG